MVCFAVLSSYIIFGEFCQDVKIYPFISTACALNCNYCMSPMTCHTDGCKPGFRYIYTTGNEFCTSTSLMIAISKVDNKKGAQWSLDSWRPRQDVNLNLKIKLLKDKKKKKNKTKKQDLPQPVPLENGHTPDTRKKSIPAAQSVLDWTKNKTCHSLCPWKTGMFQTPGKSRFLLPNPCLTVFGFDVYRAYLHLLECDDPNCYHCPDSPTECRVCFDGYFPNAEKKCEGKVSVMNFELRGTHDPEKKKTKELSDYLRATCI